MKSNSINKVVCGLIVVILTLIPCSAMADIIGTVDIAHDGYGAHDTAHIWGGGWYSLEVYAGVYMLNKTADTGQGVLWDNGLIGAFCIELTEYSSAMTNTYDVALPEEAHNPTTFLGESIGSVKANYISELWGRFYDPAWATGGSYTSAQNEAAEAFAVALWEIIYEDLPGSSSGWDVTSDGTDGDLGFKATFANASLANSWLHALDGQGSRAQLRAFTYNGTQDFITQVPEPTTIVLLSLGSLVFIRSRKTA